jgi:N-acetylglucosamine repressor
MAESKIGNSELISTLNTRLVLQAVRVTQPTFRAEVARRTGLKPATITNIVNSLIEQGMLREVASPVDVDEVRSGRPPLMLEVNGDVKHVLAVDLEPDRIRVALTNALLEEVDYREQLIDRFSKPDPVCDRILKLCNEIQGSISRGNVLGVGVSLPGLIDRERGILISSTNMPKWQNVPIGPILHRHLKLPVRVERSVRLAALYEQWSNPHLTRQTTLIISLRTGVGFSLIDHGQLYVGNAGLDGEIGHMVIDITGRQCECGSRGCLETFVSASAICTHAEDLMKRGRCKLLKERIRAGEPLTPELIYILARGGDRDCGKIVAEVGRYLGIAVANMINLLAPHEVIISGAIDVADELILQAIQNQVNSSALPRTRVGVIIRLAREREKRPLLGAAALVAQEMFELPKLAQGAHVLRNHQYMAARR